MDDRDAKGKHQAGQWAGMGVFAIYVLVAWFGLELQSPALGQEPAIGIFAVVGVFVAIAAIKVVEYVAARRRRARGS